MTVSIGTNNKLFRRSFFPNPYFDINNIINKSVNLIKLNISVNSVWLHSLFTLVVVRNLDHNNNDAFPC